MNGRRYQVRYAETAAADLRGLPKPIAAQIIRKVQRLENGLQGNIKPLREADFGYRLRMGDYRILFDLEGDMIVIQRIGHRKDIYD
jgi:mRNA interferase RelE/StbE